MFVGFTHSGRAFSLLLMDAPRAAKGSKTRAEPTGNVENFLLQATKIHRLNSVLGQETWRVATVNPGIS